MDSRLQSYYLMIILEEDPKIITLENLYYISGIVLVFIALVGLNIIKETKKKKHLFMRLKKEIEQAKNKIKHDKLYTFCKINIDFFESKKNYIYENYSPNEIGLIELCYSWIQDYNIKLTELESEINKLQKVRCTSGYLGCEGTKQITAYRGSCTVTTMNRKVDSII